MYPTTEPLRNLIRLLTAPDPIAPTAGESVMRLPRETGIVVEINEETYDHFLDALPVHFMSGHLFCFAEGFAPHTLFFRRGKRFFCRQLTTEETDEFCRLADIPLPGYG